MKYFAPFITLMLLLFMANACYYNSEEYLFPDINMDCDTLNVTFASSIVPVLEGRCFTCHSNGNAPIFGGNIRLQDYQDVKLRVDDGRLLGAITHAPGFVPMPDGAAKLSECTLDMFRIWIDEGAPNN